MTGLLASEVRRLTSRRMFRIVALVVLGITALVLLRTFAWSERPTEASRQRAVAEAANQREQCERFKNEMPGFPQEESCDFSADDFDDGRQLVARDALDPTTKTVGVVTMMLAFVIGSTFIGADWNAGTMQALLFWEPRRARVILAKAVALVGVMLGFLVAFFAVLYLGIWLVAATRGSTEGLTSGIHLSNLLSLARGGVLVTFGALLGYGAAGLARTTAASLAGGFGYFVGGELAIRLVRPNWERFLVSRNVDAVLNKKTLIFDQSSNSESFEPSRPFELGGGRATLTLVIYLALLLGAFYYSFTRRDVT